MFRLLALAAVGACLVPSPRVHAQVTATAPETEAPQYAHRWDFYGGAQYSHFNPSPERSVQAINLLGWNGTATLWLGSTFGLDASARGLYGTLVVPSNNEGIPANPQMSEHLALFGPNFRLLRHTNYTFGMHSLIGAAYGSFSSGFPAGTMPQDVGIYNDKLALGLAVGPWVDYNLGSQLSVRLISDWQPTHYGFTWQNEFAGSVGIVYRFGARTTK
ncbi:MAG TPA: hypothetical protein VL990_01660 [Acidobacteriaceae bacterium]|nr:hypothetical protein [Acidobacteriaceae bacterium]